MFLNRYLKDKVYPVIFILLFELVDVFYYEGWFSAAVFDKKKLITLRNGERYFSEKS